jgi:hypothetical protein
MVRSEVLLYLSEFKWHVTKVPTWPRFSNAGSSKAALSLAEGLPGFSNKWPLLKTVHDLYLGCPLTNVWPRMASAYSVELRRDTLCARVSR